MRCTPEERHTAARARRCDLHDIAATCFRNISAYTGTVKRVDRATPSSKQENGCVIGDNFELLSWAHHEAPV